MKKNILSLVAVGLVLSSFAGVFAAPSAEAQCNNNNNRNQARQIRRQMQRLQRMQQQARFNQFNNPYLTQASLNSNLYGGCNPYMSNQFGNQFGNQFNNPYLYGNYNNGLLGGNGLVGGVQGLLGRLF